MSFRPTDEHNEHLIGNGGLSCLLIKNSFVISVKFRYLKSENRAKLVLVNLMLLIGCGGLGSAASLYLAAAGVGKLVVIDDDRVDSSNLQRQVIYREGDIELAKTEAMAQQLRHLNSLIQVRTITKRLDQAQLRLEVMLADVVLDCSDNLPTRQQINQVCYEQNTPLISAAAIGWQGSLLF